MGLANPWQYILFWVVSIKNQVQDQVQGSTQERTVSGILIDPRSSFDWSRVLVDQLSIKLIDEESENHVFFSLMCSIWSLLMGWVIITLIREPWVQKKIEKIFYDVVAISVANVANHIFFAGYRFSVYNNLSLNMHLYFYVFLIRVNLYFFLFIYRTSIGCFFTYIFFFSFPFLI